MSPQVLAGLVVIISVAAWLGFLGYITLFRRREAEEEVPVPEPEEALVGATQAQGAPAYVVETAAPEPRPKPRRPEEDVQGVTRRQFLNRAWVAAILVGFAQFSMASLSFLYPRLRGGLGSKITVDLQGLTDADAIKSRLSSSRTPEFVSDGRFFVAAFEGNPAEAGEVPAYQLTNAASTGVVAMFRKCVHLGCSVPWCASAKWFECPCHGSKYSINGEYRDGPAPRGLDRFPVEIVNGQLIVDTGTLIEGPPRGTVTGQPQPEGEHCVTFEAPE
ncbi:MAG: ubiquinol-cytochrome c reductase iron-sulfur subunit [Actinomycetota bacterium]